jgi:hypothetical protein
LIESVVFEATSFLCYLRYDVFDVGSFLIDAILFYHVYVTVLLHSTEINLSILMVTRGLSLIKMYVATFYGLRTAQITLI